MLVGLEMPGRRTPLGARNMFVCAGVTIREKRGSGEVDVEKRTELRAASEEKCTVRMIQVLVSRRRTGQTRITRTWFRQTSNANAFRASLVVMFSKSYTRSSLSYFL